MLLSDKDLVKIAPSIIHPFIFGQIRHKRKLQEPNEHGTIEVAIKSVVSFGLSSHGYDIRLSDEDFRLFSPVLGAMEINVKNFNPLALVSSKLKEDEYGRYFVIPPFHYALGITVEIFDIPRDVMGICLGKSTYARVGLLVNTTPLEAGWQGKLVVELSNVAPLPIRVYADEGIGQVIFLRSSTECDTSYADRDGKYQHQQELTTAKV